MHRGLELVSNGGGGGSPESLTLLSRNVTILFYGHKKFRIIRPHVSLISDRAFYSRVLWSKPIPLAWYFAPQWEREYGSKWMVKQCDVWTMNDRYLKNFAAEIPLCPCTLEHALADKGRFLPDFDCDKDANPACYYHKGAVHCVRTGAPRSVEYIPIAPF